MEGERAVRRFYEELWNRWRLELVDELLAPGLRFRGTLGTVCEGRDEFRAYVERVRTAFPDWRNRIEEVVVAGDRVVTRMTWSGTHRGPLGEVEPTGARVEYPGAAFFRLVDGRIEAVWAVGDTAPLWRALGVEPPGG